MSSNEPGDPATVQLASDPDPGARWQPHVGSETLDLLNHLDDLDAESRMRIRDEALSTLRACLPPMAPDGSETGLVVGHVQSGKTMSFTTIAALAKDNRYPLIIIITGTSVPLSNQSRSRIEKDLRLLTRDDRQWQHFHNPRVRPTHQLQAITAKLAEWRDERTPPVARRTILITVMKNHRHLSQLTALLQRLDLAGLPVLVIDDEGDQAGLNNLVNQGRRSTTYQCLIALRQLLAHHTYLQYTATPQAPLLINVIDALSPRFAQVLTPGPDYVGGHEFFLAHADLIHTIPAVEIPASGNTPTEPPASLQNAMRLFFLGVAAGIATDGGVGNRSMMIHPSQQRVLHANYVHWVNNISANWWRTLDLDPADPDRTELVDDFRTSFTELQRTVEGLPSFESLVAILGSVIRGTRIWEVNTSHGPTPEIDWRSDYSHILVGGQAMDRGFTVEGLTVTYMPRGVGTGTADTIQQRARFFGYKRQYLGFCRIYLEAASRAAYQQYVAHEDNLRESLARHRLAGRPLTEWKRAFFLDRALAPTRRSVMDLAYLHDVLADEWYVPKAPHDSDAAIADNRVVVQDFLQQLTVVTDPGSAQRSDIQKHHLAENVPLERVADLLTRLRVTRGPDSQRFTGVLLQISAFLQDHEDAACSVYVMSQGLQRNRTVDDHDELPTLRLFQGAHPVNPPAQRGTIYPGDTQIHAPTGLTVQIHRLHITAKDGCVMPDVPDIAIWVPREMAQAWLVQEPPT